MSEDKGRDGLVGTDPTLTPSQLVGSAPTGASTEPAVHAGSSKGSLPQRYAPGPLLGAGGMGEVVLARDIQIDRDVAIKRLRTAPTAEALARFEREAKIQGRLDHPAIVPVHELATDSEGMPFFVMKRLSGSTLEAIIAASASSTRQKLLRAFADVCLAVEFAHERGVIHRDLKPSNIMLGNYGEVYVLDWGVARLVDERETPATGVGAVASDDAATVAGGILGTPGYIAPESLRGEPVDRRGDIYALGCILFEILCGEPLLPRGRAALEAALGPVDARPAQRGVQDVPPELEALCVDMTANDKTRRPTAREVVERIEKYLDGDRDLALRKSVSRGHGEAARAALATGDGETERATAMREAGRAIAIDPENRDAAELVAQLMLQPPREVPTEVDARVAEIEGKTIREKVRLMASVELSLLLSLPLLYAMGIRSRTALALFFAVLGTNIVTTVIGARRARAPSVREIYAAATLFACLVGVVAYLFSPFLLAPAMGAVTVMSFAVDPRTRWVPLSGLYICAVFVPWALELSGVLTRSMYNVGGDLAIHAALVDQKMPEAAIGLAAFTVGLLVIAGVIASRLAQAQRRAVRSVELQAWHLRQLVRG